MDEIFVDFKEKIPKIVHLVTVMGKNLLCIQAYPDIVS